MNEIDVFRSRGDKYFEATEFSPRARESERSKLLELVRINRGDRICDLQSAAGYVPDGIYERHGDNVSVVCVEPSKALSKNIHPRFGVVNCELENLELDDNSFDVVLTLAGVHHSRCLREIVSESHRILKDGGQIAFSEVESGSAMDTWLNDFCDRWTDDGHDGKFVKQGQFSSEFKRAGFTNVEEFVGHVPWFFTNFEDMVTFCKKLFGLNKASREIVADGIKSILPIEFDGERVILNWSLVYCSALKS